MTKSFNRLLLAAALGAATLVATSGGANAAVVCNRQGDCWHTHERVAYPGGGYVRHPDDWYFHQTWNNDHRWHEAHEGRGYWRNNVWVSIR